ncbi:ABC transporter substrate-binding protein [Paracoccus sp. M683]|uniref:ABC transporter substrate-binding protein n=1 Tax=Paracoccus sp. M683 TaxID=2594268 RepID=UPI00117C65DA|nr:ABC transporter substrate-binding protein [Paracoccus sp. M683]TRW99380.1 ABC transporter substrate-binding protein [Paracoccus sp. M683]
MKFLIALIFTCLAVPALAQDMRQITDDAGRDVAVPVRPLRIVSMHDLDLTIPLIELGVMPVASHGRMGLNGIAYLRSGAILTGVDFDNSDIAYIGSVNADIEAVIAARPDLILTEPGRATPVEQLEKIAPTVVIDNTLDGAPHIYRRLADLTGTEARLAVLEHRYQAQIAALQAAVDSQQISVSVMQAQNGKVAAWHTYRALGRVLRDAGFRFPALIDQIPPGERIEISAERLPELDADYIFAPYRSDTGGKPADEIAAMEALFPGFCQFLLACQEGRYILIPREEAISNSYAGLALMVAVVQSHIAGRPQITRP